jgi:hypothetical protein
MTTKLIRCDSRLWDLICHIEQGVAKELKEKYNLDEIFVSHTLASNILAAKHFGKNKLSFRIEKTGLNKGILIISET